MARGMTAPGSNRSKVGTLRIDPVTLDETLSRLDGFVRSRQRVAVNNVNAHAVCLAEDQPAFRAAINEAALVFCDGKPVQWASRFLGQPLPERFTPPDWIDRLCALARDRNYRLFFLGGAEGVAQAAADQLTARHPGLHIDCHHGYFVKNGDQNASVIDVINRSRPNFLFVGFGMPMQELWIADNLDRLDVNVALSVGGMFDFISGSKVRGPRWLTDHGFEWLTRLVREPRRLAPRYLVGNARFVWIVVRSRIRGA